MRYGPTETLLCLAGHIAAKRTSDARSRCRARSDAHVALFVRHHCVPSFILWIAEAKPLNEERLARDDIDGPVRHRGRAVDVCRARMAWFQVGGTSHW